MGKAALLSILAFGLAGAMYTVSTQRGLADADEQVADHQREFMARNAALAGQERAEQYLAGGNYNDKIFTGTYQGVPYRTELDVSGVLSTLVSGAQATVHSVGTASGANGSVEVPYNVRTRYESEGDPEMAEEPPEFMKQAIFADENLDINGNVSADVLDADADASNILNADMRTNGDLNVNGGAASVRGFGLFAGTATGKVQTTDCRDGGGGGHPGNGKGNGHPGNGKGNGHPGNGKGKKKKNKNKKDEDTCQGPTFKPYGNEALEAPVQKVGEIDIPDFDVDTYEGKTSVDQTVGGNLDLSGAGEGNAIYDSFDGTREDPYVVKVEGSLDTGGNTEIPGYTVFLVEGNVRLRGNASAGKSGYDGADESNVAFYSEREVTMRGNTEIHGQIFAQGDASFKGNPRVVGSITTHGTLNFSGNPDIFYRGASPALTKIWEDGEPIMKMASRNEW